MVDSARPGRVVADAPQPIGSALLPIDGEPAPRAPAEDETPRSESSDGTTESDDEASEPLPWLQVLVQRRGEGRFRWRGSEGRPGLRSNAGVALLSVLGERRSRLLPGSPSLRLSTYLCRFTC